MKLNQNDKNYLLGLTVILVILIMWVFASKTMAFILLNIFAVGFLTLDHKYTKHINAMLSELKIILKEIRVTKLKNRKT